MSVQQDLLHDTITHTRPLHNYWQPCSPAFVIYCTKTWGGAREWGFSSKPSQGKSMQAVNETLLYTSCVCPLPSRFLFSLLWNDLQLLTSQVCINSGLHRYHELLLWHKFPFIGTIWRVRCKYSCTVELKCTCAESLFMYCAMVQSRWEFIHYGTECRYDSIGMWSCALWLISGDESLIRWCWFGLEICWAYEYG